MVCKIILAYRIAPRGAEEATSYKKLTIVTTKIYKKKQKTEENQAKLI